MLEEHENEETILKNEQIEMKTNLAPAKVSPTSGSPRKKPSSVQISTKLHMTSQDLLIIVVFICLIGIVYVSRKTLKDLYLPSVRYIELKSPPMPEPTEQQKITIFENPLENA